MKNQLENLEKYLSMLENGVPLEEVVEQMDETDANLSESLVLAAKLRSLPRVTSDQQSAAKQDAIIHAMIESNSLREGKSIGAKIRDWFFARPKSFVRVSSLVVILSVFLAVFLLFITNPQTSSASIRIADIKGQVEVVQSEQDTTWKVLKINDELTAGQKIKTGANSSIELELPDQSVVRLAEDTEITINSLSNNKKEGLTFLITQHIGNTYHQVALDDHAVKNYVIDTPSNKINVHGTNFNVNVNRTGRTIVRVYEGLVNVRGADKEITITPGFAIETIPGKTPSTPLHSFSSYGVVLKQEKNVWEMEDFLFFVNDETMNSQLIGPGDYIVANGRILPNGDWVADMIEKIETTEYLVSFTGIINFISDDFWVIDDKSVIVSEETKKPDNLSVGDLVKIVYNNQNNLRRTAVQIDLLSNANKGKASEKEKSEGSKPNQSGLSFTTENLEIEGCELQFTLSSGLVNGADTDNAIITNTSIDYQLLSGKKYVKQVTLEPSFVDEIPAGESTQFSIQIDVSDEWLATDGADEIKLRIRIDKQNANPDSIDGLLVTIRKHCENNNPVAENQDPAENEDTQSEEELPTDENTTADAPSCVGVSSHPQGQQLANIYGVSYDEIMAWFCEGFGFGEIDLAYFYAQKAGIPVIEIFVLVQDGMDWGEIITQLGLEK
jgi:hypothetical protein